MFASSMLRNIFYRHPHALRRAFLASTLLLPLYFSWHFSKTCSSNSQVVPAIQLAPSPISVPPQNTVVIQYANTIPEKISQYEHKNIIIYFMSGDFEEDEKVKRLVEKYHNQYNPNIHVIFVKPSLNQQFATLQLCFLTKRNYSKDIQKICFSREMETLSELQFSNNMVKKLQKFIKNIPEISAQDLNAMTNSRLIRVALKANKSSPDYTKYRVLFENFMERDFVFKKMEFMIVTDDQAAGKLGLENVPDGSIHMYVPSDNQLLKVEAQNNFLRIGDQEYALIKDINNDKILKDNFIFMPFVNHWSDYMLQLRVNNNKITMEDKQKLFSLCKALNEPVHIRYDNIDKTYELNFSKHDDLSYKILKQEMPELSVQEKMRHLTIPKQFMYKGIYTKQSIQEWLENIRKGEVEPYYRSEKTPKIDMHSHRLTGKNFQQIMVSTDNEVVFYYSDHCHNCAKFGQLYQEIAKENYSDDKLVMNHIEVEKNEMSCGYNIPLTPTLAFFKLDCKTKPFSYDLKLLSRNAINNFVEITKDVKLVDDDMFSKFVQTRAGYNYQM